MPLAGWPTSTRPLRKSISARANYRHVPRLSPPGHRNHAQGALRARAGARAAVVWRDPARSRPRSGGGVAPARSGEPSSAELQDRDGRSVDLVRSSGESRTSAWATMPARSPRGSATRTLAQTGWRPGRANWRRWKPSGASRDDTFRQSVALRFYEEAIDLAGVLGDSEAAARLGNAAGIIEWTRGRHVEALAHFERALALFEEADDHAGAGLMMNSIAVTLGKLGRRGEAREGLDEALLHHQRTGQRHLEGSRPRCPRRLVLGGQRRRARGGMVRALIGHAAVHRRRPWGGLDAAASCPRTSRRGRSNRRYASW